MKLPDVNILVTAHRVENRGHERVHGWLHALLNDRQTFLYCDWILSAFVRIVTHPKIYRDPTPLPRALEFAQIVRSRPNGVGVMPGRRHWSIFQRLSQSIEATGNDVPDAYLAALAIEAEATWVTLDAGFGRFAPELDLHLLAVD